MNNAKLVQPIFRYNISSNTAQLVPTTLLANSRASSGAAVAVAQNRVLLFGGTTLAGVTDLFGEVGVSTDTTNAFQDLLSANAPQVMATWLAGKQLLIQPVIS
jgi:hypothetical protein